MSSTRLRQIVDTDYHVTWIFFWIFFYHTSAGRERLRKMIVMITDAPNTHNACILCLAPSNQASKTILRLRSDGPEGEETQERYCRRGTNTIFCLPESPPSRRDSIRERKTNG